MKYGIIMAFIALAIASGCVSRVDRNEGLVVTMAADPPQVFQNQATTVFIDLDNRDGKKINNVIFELFDAGIMDIVEGPQEQEVTTSYGEGERGDLEYTVQRGDILWNIVKRYYPELTVADRHETNQRIAAKVNEVVDYNVGRLPHLIIDNIRFNKEDDPSTYEKCPGDPCDYIR
ncbi:MAG: hypothetical protein QMD85_04385, partial [Candidatus Aenigmarchaeota archaeon]|nr:hypothetical protein [Candidatus Aenigmarchaeota archaeon]MDI6722810.1 hypothetical protein [Candidatus Aenigmarchaeota archaeon]